MNATPPTLSKMANHILLSQIRHNGIHLRHCFCPQCRTRKYQEILDAGFTPGQLFDITFKRILQSEEAKLNELFQLTKRKIVFGKAYKHSCLHNTAYTDFGWWARTQPNFMRLPQKVRENFCKCVVVGKLTLSTRNTNTSGYFELLFSLEFWKTSAMIKSSLQCWVAVYNVI